MQLWHGTADDTLHYPNFGEEIKQWTNVLGVSQTPVSHRLAAVHAGPAPATAQHRPRRRSRRISVQVRSHNMPRGRHGRVHDRVLRPERHDADQPAADDPEHVAAVRLVEFVAAARPVGPCRVSDTINAWNTGLTANITITNTGSTAINGWSLAFTLPAGQTITSGWNATYSPASGAVTARNISYNGALNPGGSTTIGFQATHTGNTAAPTAFTLNGAACTVA